MGAVDGAAVQIQNAVGAQLGQQQRVKLGPDAGLGPVPQPPPAGHSRTAEQAGGQLVPGDAGLEDEHDAGQSGTVIDRPTSRTATAARLGSRQQRFDSLPQPIGHEFLDHPPQPRHGPTVLEGGAPTSS
jgi:hypothetical protein